MDIRHLALLRELAERGSVTAVAAATHRTPSAVSQQLKSAAREFGVPLTEAHGRGLRLTQAGLLLAVGGADVAVAVEKVQASLDAFRSAPTGMVTLAALPSAATYLLPAVIAELSSEPIEIRCDDVDISEDEFPALAADYDIVLGHSLSSAGPRAARSLRTRKLLREPLDIALPGAHRLATQQTLDPQQLVDERWIGVPTGFPFDTVLQEIERHTGHPLRVVQRVRDNRLVEALVAAGHGIAVLPRFTTPATSQIALRPMADIPTGRYVFVTMRPDRAERLATRRVVEALVRAARVIAP